jgi:hypothetical protein
MVVHPHPWCLSSTVIERSCEWLRSVAADFYSRKPLLNMRDQLLCDMKLGITATPKRPDLTSRASSDSSHNHAGSHLVSAEDGSAAPPQIILQVRLWPHLSLALPNHTLTRRQAILLSFTKRTSIQCYRLAVSKLQ